MQKKGMRRELLKEEKQNFFKRKNNSLIKKFKGHQYFCKTFEDSTTIELLTNSNLLTVSQHISKKR